jgi:hypothetical protein
MFTPIFMRPAQCQTVGHHSAVARLNILSAIVPCFESCSGCVPVGGKGNQMWKYRGRSLLRTSIRSSRRSKVLSQARDPMRQQQSLRIALSDTSGSVTQQLELFALLNLGLVQSLASGVLSPTDAVQRFYHADNCLYVQKHLRHKEANAIMSHGVQLPDLFESLPAEEAQREFNYELETIRSLCLKLLAKRRPADATQRATA